MLGGRLQFDSCIAESGWGGGAIVWRGDALLKAEAVFANCSAGRSGGGLYIGSGSVTHSDKTSLQFSNCTAVERSALFSAGSIHLSRLYIHACIDQAVNPIASGADLLAEQIILSYGGHSQEAQAYIGSRNLQVNALDCTAIDQCWALGKSQQIQTLRCSEGTETRVYKARCVSSLAKIIPNS